MKTLLRAAWPIRPPRIPLAGMILITLAGLAATACDEKPSTPNYGDQVARALREGKASGARGDLQALAIAITNYASNENGLPEASNIDELAAKLEPGYMRQVKRTDPWGTPYQYSTDGSGYLLSSAGVDKTFGTEDDMEMRDGQITKMPKSYERFGP